LTAINKTICTRLFMISLVFTVFFHIPSYTQPSQTVSRVVFQGFWWDYWNANFQNGWANYLTELAPRLKAMGFDAVWIPPAAKNSAASSVGYAPFDMYDLGDKYQKANGNSTRMGTKDELLRMIAVLHANGIEVIEDMVLNHCVGANSVGGQDPETNYSMQSADGFKNFRYVSYKTPRIDESQNDYWSRSGRWAKNYSNFHPNYMNNCNTGDICSAYWGPDIDYETPGAFGQSSNIPTSGMAVINNVSRPYYNPVQSDNYMLNGARDYLAWFKKQTGIDGFRFDAVKHYSIYAQNSFIMNIKYNLPAFANGGQYMMSFGEWIGNQYELDNYVTSVASGGEEHTGTTDISLRGYSTNGSGIYGLIMGGGYYDMQNIPYCQQGKRYTDYGSTRVYRTVPFVNSHDNFRPILLSNGNFSSALGDPSGWDMAYELGGNGSHIDPRDPRLAAAYAVVFAVDGNPSVYFEDLFDIGTTGKRYSHLPASETELPVRDDILNILQAHQKLAFKSGSYAVPTALGGSSAPYYAAGSSADHLVIERVGRAVIGITDAYFAVSDNSQDQQVWVSTSDAGWHNVELYDYSGAHGLTTTHVYNDGRVLIKTAPNGHGIPGAKGHGYSIWAPAPAGITFTTVGDLYNYLATYAPHRSTSTAQEWEMAGDLGDSHCSSLGQGGSLPDSSSNERIACKVYPAGNTLISCTVWPEIDGRDLTVSLYDATGDMVATNSGISSSSAPLTLSYTTTAEGWISVKVRNTMDNYAGQRCWVDVNYTAPQTVNTRIEPGKMVKNISFWTGNKNTTIMSDCANWEEGTVPGSQTSIVIYGHNKPLPVLNYNLTVKGVNIKTDGKLTISPGKILTVN
jgi:glycosidase